MKSPRSAPEQWDHFCLNHNQTSCWNFQTDYECPLEHWLSRKKMDSRKNIVTDNNSPQKEIIANLCQKLVTFSFSNNLQTNKCLTSRNFFLCLLWNVEWVTIGNGTPEKSASGLWMGLIATTGRQAHWGLQNAVVALHHNIEQHVGNICPTSGKCFH